MLNIRRARIGEEDILTNIAIRSEAYWNYDSTYMESFKLLYKVTGEFLSSSITFVMEKDETIIGFYSIINSNKETSLEYFYIETESIGKGYGKLLWNHMIDNCRKFGIDEITLVTSPQAVGFYTKMGAVLCGEVDSLVVNNRRIPRLVYTIKK